MAINIGPGIEIGPGITIDRGFVPSATLIYDLDAANYSALPVNGTKDATGTYTLTVQNTTSRLSWNAANGGVFRLTGSGTTTSDTIYGGPNYTTGQSYTVFMAYKLAFTAVGRLLNTAVEAQKDWLLGSYSAGSNYMNVFYPNGTVNLSSDIANTNWQFIWGTFNTSTNVANLYIASNTQPSAIYKTATNAGFGGFNNLRLFSRSSGSEVQTGDIGFVKAYSGVLTLTDVQGLYNQYKTRFGY